ncbi:PLDc N-terminal domain-containing protein [Winogradskyella helgolandensis]|uniref:PLDc N-terminal domain-containing protein n=1 Tax=Winogradskyella helgolandensis TaxID=2697010 RepID=UPI0015C7C56F|nr:PLDc N-terminal domain-containing protein [Winogradskyella helgolandensis]
MKNKKFIHSSFIGSLLFSIIGSILKLNYHSSFANSFLFIGVILTLIFLILGVIEINKSTRLSKHQKTLWTIGLIAFFNIGSIIYYFIGRKRV